MCSKEVIEDYGILPIFGVKCETVLNELDFFNVFTSQTVGHMHDILEGIAQLVVKL